MKKYFVFFIIMLSFAFNQAQTNEDLANVEVQVKENVRKTFYVFRPLINGDDLQNWAHEQGLTILSKDSFHVTLAYSRGGLENWPEEIIGDSNYYCNSDLDHLRHLDFFGKEKSVLVLKLKAPELVERWKEFIAAGAKWDWPIFEPHITLTYDAKDVDIEQITPYHGDLIFGPEVYVEFN